VLVVAGVVLAIALIAWLGGFHVGPQAHVAAGVLALIAAGWMVVLALRGQSAPLLWTLVGVALFVAATAAVGAWFGLRGKGVVTYDPHALEGAEAIAVSDLDPEGRVRVRGEIWKATAVNGTARVGTRVQVLRVSGLHLEVWAEEPEI
jgi:membrane protein implicated in regulation of membrane protease activity